MPKLVRNDDFASGPGRYAVIDGEPRPGGGPDLIAEFTTAKAADRYVAMVAEAERLLRECRQRLAFNSDSVSFELCERIEKLLGEN